MKSIAILTAVWAALFSAVAGAPTELAETKELQPRTYDAWVELFSDNFWTGKFKRYEVKYNECVVVTEDFPPWTEGGVSSIRVGPWHVSECIIFSNTKCDLKSDSDIGGDRLYVGYFYDELGYAEINWGDRTHAFKCIPD